MKRLYGDKIRKIGGVEEGLSEIFSEVSEKHPIIRKTTEKIKDTLLSGSDHLC